MTLEIFFTILAIIFITMGCSLYLYGILKRTVVPHPFTWLGWSILVGIVGFIQYIESIGWAFLVLSIESVFLFIIFISSLKYGEKKIYKTDIISFLTGILAIILWILTDNPLYSVILITLADILMFIPTIRKTFDHPFDEDLTLYGTAAFAYIFSYFAFQEPSLVTFLYPGTLVVTDILFILFTVYLRKKQNI